MVKFVSFVACLNHLTIDHACLNHLTARQVWLEAEKRVVKHVYLDKAESVVYCQWQGTFLGDGEIELIECQPAARWACNITRCRIRTSLYARCLTLTRSSTLVPLSRLLGFREGWHFTLGTVVSKSCRDACVNKKSSRTLLDLVRMQRLKHPRVAHATPQLGGCHPYPSAPLAAIISDPAPSDYPPRRFVWHSPHHPFHGRNLPYAHTRPCSADRVQTMTGCPLASSEDQQR